MILISALLGLAISQAAPPQTPQPPPAKPPGSAPAPPTATPPANLPVPAPPPATAPPPGPAPKVLNPVAVLTAPTPTASPTFGQVVCWAHDEPIVTGPMPSRVGGFEGQICSFIRKDGGWAPRIEMPGVPDLRNGDFTLQRLAGGPDVLVTNIDRKNALRSELVVFQPDSGPAGWKQVATITTPGGEEAPGFGSAFATDGTFIVASEADTRIRPGKPDVLPGSPKVDVFAKDANGAWTRVSTVQRDAASKSVWFGASLALDARFLVVGKPRSMLPIGGEPLRMSGESLVCVYRRDGANWPLDAEIKGAEVTPWPGFGVGVAADADLIAVRANEVAGPGTRVFVYRRVNGSWKSEGELLPGAGATTGRLYGAAMAISHGRILVGDGSAKVEGGPPDNGAVFCFEQTPQGWRETMRLIQNAPSLPGTFGFGLAVHGDDVLVNRTQWERGGVPIGGAFLFKLPAPSASAESRK